MSNPRVFGISASNGADQEHGSTKTVVNVVQSFLCRAHERRAVEKWKQNVKIVEITVDEVSHKVNIWKLELHRRGLQ